MSFIRSRQTGEEITFDVLQGDRGNRYRLNRYPLNKGRGGNGLVFEATALAPDGRPLYPCAVKILNNLTPQRVDRFRNEIRIMEMLGNFERVATFHDSGEIGHGNLKFPWLAMVLGGPNFRESIASNGPIPVEGGLLRRVALQMCDALIHIHERKIIHRDIKHQNFVWAPVAFNMKPRDVLMLDFGIAKCDGEDVSGRPFDELTQEAEFVGPAHTFASPELVAYWTDKGTVVDHRSDLWQFGRVLWFLATTQLVTSMPDVDDDPTHGKLFDLVMQLTAHKPSKRPASATILRELLSGALPE